MTRPVVIVDCETTSLTPDYETGSGVIWELAVIFRSAPQKHLWRMKPDLSAADPRALRIGQFHQRTACMPSWVSTATVDLARPQNEAGIPIHNWSPRAKLASEVARLLADAVIVAANPAFDAGFIAAFLRHHGEAPAWHYRLRDIGSMAYGYLWGAGKRGPWMIDAGTDDFARALGVDPENFDRHTAMGDCLMVEAMLDVIERGAA